MSPAVLSRRLTALARRLERTYGRPRRRLHLNLIRLGREVCRRRSPRCPICPLRGVCRHARARA